MRFQFHDPANSTTPVVSIDGVTPTGPNFSHWPGNRTPKDLRHDLSTGIALQLARLTEAQRHERFEGLETITNTHFDTDGVLAAYALLEPEFALAHEALFLDAARTGDFQAFTTEEALALDLLISATSPGPSTEEPERRQAQYEAAFERLPAFCKDPIGAIYADDELAITFDTIVVEVESVATDTVGVERVPDLDLAIVTSGLPICRHALHAAAGDLWRVLSVVPCGFGHLYRLHDRVESWFDLVSVTHSARVPFGPLATFLEELEVSETEPHWHAHPVDVPIPECWFGEFGTEASFGPASPGDLCVSRLSPRIVKRAVTDHLRRGTTQLRVIRGGKFDSAH